MKQPIAVCLFALLALPALVQAQNISLKTLNGGTLGILVSDQSFEADRGGVFDMHLAGKKLGISGSFTQVLPNDWYWGGDARMAWGATTFSSATRGSNSASPETLTDIRFTVGRDLQLGKVVLSPYAGLGYRSLVSFLNGYTTSGHISPARDSTLVYLPLGLTHRFRLGPDARIASTLEYKHLLQGTQRTKYTDIAGYTNDLNVTQNKGRGMRLGLARETSRWSAGVYYHYWDIQESELGTYANTTTVFSATEAHNISREVGIQIKFQFH